jgi:hypothetical protein
MTNQEIDELVATRVMGWRKPTDDEVSKGVPLGWYFDDTFKCGRDVDSFCPSMDLDEAVNAAEKWRDEQDNRTIEIVSGKEWGVQLAEWKDGTKERYRCVNKSLARAICEALLKASE